MGSLAIMRLIFIIPLGFVALGKYVSWKTPFGVVDTAQKSPYECGFAPFQSGRHPFSLYFFLVALIFIIFDSELVFLLPLPLFGDLGVSGIGVFLFLWVLLAGLYHEWREGSLDWPLIKGTTEAGAP